VNKLNNEIFRTRWISFSLTSRLVGVRREFHNSYSLYLNPWLCPQTKGSQSVFSLIFKSFSFCIFINFMEASECSFFTSNAYKHFPSQVRWRARSFRAAGQSWAAGSDFLFDRRWCWGRDSRAQELDGLYHRNGAVGEGAGAGLGSQKIRSKVSFLENMPISLKNKIIHICIRNI